MTDISWVIGDIVATSAVQNIPTITRGGSESVMFYFQQSSGISGSSYGYTSYGGGNYGSSLYTGVGGYYRLKDYIEYASDTVVSTYRGGDGTPKFRLDDLPPEADISDLLVAVEPGGDVDRVPEYWALIMGGEDVSRVGGGASRMRVEFHFLAPVQEYSSEQDVISDLGTPLI